ncbi:MAG: PhoH family protein [Myxococcales bacterium]|nr:PhoH family protein [Myxococcales bacterium]
MPRGVPGERRQGQIKGARRERRAAIGLFAAGSPARARARASVYALPKEGSPPSLSQSRSYESASRRTASIEVESTSVLLALSGPQNVLLAEVSRQSGAEVSLRGNVLYVAGEEDDVRVAQRFLTDAAELVSRGHEITASDVGRALRELRLDPDTSLVDLLDEAILVSPRRRAVMPKSPAQRGYIEAIRKHDLTFGIGPAGTGKTYLAMAMAASALMQKRVKRIVLTRPAVEAGEKLGFLPGDLAEKVNPYLRPLYDALHDMLDFEKVEQLRTRGQIEVAPLAFMRGRAQPYFTPVLTPTGFRPIGSLRPGDSVIGSNGRATKVLGVYPQGPREVFRVSAQDGASTLCCGEHLWTVYTPEDRNRTGVPRVLQTREMIGRLRRAHQHRYELPLLSAPAKLMPRDVPMDPYALGLLLGDGCVTGKTTPSFATADPELAKALESALEGIELVAKSGVDYVLRHVAGGRGGLRIPNPVTVTLRELDSCGARSATKFVPKDYLFNSPGVRLAMLQGLLDTDGGPVTQARRTCRVQYCTTSPELRDAVVFLVRSLGGVAYWRTRAAEGRRPGRANGRVVPYRSDAFVIDLRLPREITPFRLKRKRDKYEASGGDGRPMRYIDSIEPAGTQDCVCIQVAAPDSLYVTDDFLLTHNTLNDSFVILDEAQNATSEQMRMFLTRLGFGSKAVVTGDITQTDLPRGARSGLREARDLLTNVEGIAFCSFTDVDVVRHPIVQRIVVAYEAQDAEQARLREEKRLAKAAQEPSGSAEESTDPEPR